MKKGLLIIAVVSILIISLTACITINVEESGIYGDFNRMAKESYSSIKVMAVTQKDGVVLTDTYNFNFADENGVVDKNKGTVTYVTQRLGEFTVVEGVLTPPEAFIIEKRGEAEVKNGTITEGGEEHLYQGSDLLRRGALCPGGRVCPAGPAAEGERLRGGQLHRLHL